VGGPGKLSRALGSLRELLAHFRPIVEERRRQTARDDILGSLVCAEERGDALTNDELLATVILLLGAGHETTTNLIGNGLLALLRHPEQARRLRATPGLWPGAIEELLRYDSPNQNQGRIALEDVELAGRTIRRGQLVYCMINAANRDPAQFSDPDRLDVARDPNRHVTFGQGRHFCIGAPLARLEGRIALRALFGRFERLELATDRLEWSDSLTFRGLRALPVRVLGRRRDEVA
jgi:cytochrome P450